MRAPDFPKLTLPLFEDLKKVFKTATGQVFLFPGSGTGGWEAGLTNTLSPGDRVLVARIGQFSHLWIEMCKRLGLNVVEVDCEWGEGAPVERFAEILAEDKSHRIKAVLVTHNETATGVTSDVPGVRRVMDAAGHPAMLYVDGVSSIATPDWLPSWWISAGAAASPPTNAVIDVGERANPGSSAISTGSSRLMMKVSWRPGRPRWMPGAWPRKS
jgi:alanine-glyoxylate transaminase/serine-glyoxylate transaminase/serine-pyruvate transaminase